MTTKYSYPKSDYFVLKTLQNIYIQTFKQKMVQVGKRAKISNRCNEALRLTQDTNGRTKA